MDNFDPFERDPVVFPQQRALSPRSKAQTKEEFYKDLELTKSKTTEQAEPMVDKEVKLRLEVALLEAEATTKKRAAEEALLQAMEALDEVKSGDEAELLENDDDDATNTNKDPPTKADLAHAEDLMSINGTINAVARIMREAGEQPIEVEYVNVKEGREGPASPPAIVRRTDYHNNDDQDQDDGLKITTSILSGDETYNFVASPNHNNNNYVSSPVSPPRSVRNHAETMEDTLDAIMFKIEECTAIISDPHASMEDQLSAAQLVSQYAKAAKAFQASF